LALQEATDAFCLTWLCIALSLFMSGSVASDFMILIRSVIHRIVCSLVILIVFTAYALFLVLDDFVYMKRFLCCLLFFLVKFLFIRYDT